MKNVCGNAKIYDRAVISGNAEISGNAKIYDRAVISGNAVVSDNAVVSRNVMIYGNATIHDNAVVYDNATIHDNAVVSGNAFIYGNAVISGNAVVSDNAVIYGNARIYGDADIRGVNDWFSFIYGGKTLTGYRSRNDNRYEMNLDGVDIFIDELTDGFDVVVRNLIAKFTPFENKETTALKNVISDLEKQLEEAKNRLKEI